jgi:tRNA(Ser,Leu) C12 N-acetylase TAN1
MKDWNVIITTQPRREREVLSALNRLGTFTRPEFKGILIGRVAEVGRFLEEIRRASEEHAAWRLYLLRVLPVEQTFSFTPQTFEERLKEAVAPFIQRMVGGTFHVRLERRGYKGQIISPDVEGRLGEYVMHVATQQGKIMCVSFHDSDYVVVAETVGNLCGVALITRELRARYPFVKIR